MSEAFLVTSLQLYFFFLKHLANIPIHSCLLLHVPLHVFHLSLWLTHFCKNLIILVYSPQLAGGTLLLIFSNCLFFVFSEPQSYSALMEEKFGLDGFVFREVSFLEQALVSGIA